MISKTIITCDNCNSDKATKTANGIFCPIDRQPCFSECAMFTTLEQRDDGSIVGECSVYSALVNVNEITNRIIKVINFF